MKVSLNEIQEIFNELMNLSHHSKIMRFEEWDRFIEEKKSREEMASWNSKRQVANDSDNLEFEPASEKKKIWRGITYLMGVDLKDMDGSYLHSVENFIDFRKKTNI